MSIAEQNNGLPAKGTLYGVGVGPGDPELITLKALRIIRETPVLAWPAPLEGDSMARTIAAEHLDGHHHEIPIRMPMEVARFPAQQVYDVATDEITAELDRGRDVAVLCEGDPFFYGSFMHIYARVKDHVPTDVVPAITGMSGAWTATGAPITWGDDVLTVLMGTLGEEKLTKHIEETDALVIMKIGTNFEKVIRALKAGGKYDDAYLVQFATMGGKQTVNKLSEVTEKVTPYFSIIVVHGQGRRP